jgi:putative glutamine amidotransferase
MKAVIGVSTRLRSITTAWGDQPAHMVARLYTEAIVAAGGVPFLLPSQAPEDAVAVLDRLDGLVLTGGGDLAAHLHGRAHHQSMYEVDEERDGFELALVQESQHRALPLLAICRGAQVVNVALGGDLILDIPSEIPAAGPHHQGSEAAFLASQRVRLEPGSRLAGLLGVTELLVNSMHHQAVRSLGAGLRPVAWAEDGVIEAVEPANGPWPLWAVQWHPECLVGRDPLAGRLFEAVVTATRG